MNHDTKTQKRPELQSGAALSTVFFEEETVIEETPREENEANQSIANDAD